MNNSIQACLHEATRALRAITDTPVLEAEVLVSHILKESRAFLYTWPHKQLSEQQTTLLAQYIARRLTHEPLAYITGEREFWSLPLKVSSHTLVPRPETEHLVELVLNTLPEINTLQIAELGTGSGAIALALATERPHWQICATDICSNALAIAKANALNLAHDNISFFQGDWCSALPNLQFDAIISNPPYIAEIDWPNYATPLAHEPRNALVSGSDGLDAIRQICITAKTYLKPRAYLFLEHGFNQGLAVQALLKAANYAEICTFLDLSGLERMTIGRLPDQNLIAVRGDFLV